MEQSSRAVEGPLDATVVPLVARLRDEADLCRNENATDIAALLDEAAEEMHNLAWALSLPGFDRMATDEQEAEHQAGVQRVNDVLADRERRKTEHDAAMADAARFRWLDEVALSVDMVADPDNLVQVWHETLSGHATTGRTLREAVDEAMKRHNVELSGARDSAEDATMPARLRLSEGLGHLAPQNESPLLEVVAELGKALRKFPTWPTDPLHALAVLGEEYGELNKAMLQLVYEPHKTSAAEVRTEAIQTAAMALRLLVSLDAYEYRRAEQHQQPALAVVLHPASPVA